MTYISGTHRISDSGVFRPNPPMSGDRALAPSGHIIVLDQAVGDYALILGDATVDGFEATVNGDVESVSYSYTGDQLLGDSGTVALVGGNLNNGDLGAGGIYMDHPARPNLTIELADLVSPPGVVIQCGVLSNAGSISAGDLIASLTVTGKTNDTALVNDGSIDDYEAQVFFSTNVIGTGEINSDGFRSEGRLTFGGAVSAGQVLDLANATVTLLDPLNFRATICPKPGNWNLRQLPLHCHSNCPKPGNWNLRQLPLHCHSSCPKPGNWNLRQLRPEPRQRTVVLSAPEKG